MHKNTHKEKGDFEIISLQGMHRLFEDLSRRLLTLQRREGDQSKKRVCKYLLSRHRGLIDWIGEE